jgi:hypothetical protein
MLEVNAFGNLATPIFTAQLKVKIPRGLPTSRPKAIPSGSIEVRPDMDTPSNEIPALAMRIEAEYQMPRMGEARAPYV